MMDLRPEDIAACRAILRRGSRSFTAASRLLPGRIRDAASVVYAFCRVADDAIDGADASPAALDELRRRLERIYGGHPDDAPVDRAFAAVAERCGIPRAVPGALLEGFLWDLSGRRYETISELRAYGVRVASTVGIMMTLVMGIRSPRALARACDLGVAMQLTNSARDVGEDARAGRVYLPLAWLRRAGIDVEALVAEPRFTPGLGQVVESLLTEADRLYARADQGIPLLPRDCRASIRAARLVYAEIGTVIRARGLDSVSERAVTTRRRKVRLLLRALFGYRRRAVDGPDEPPLPEAEELVAAVAALAHS